MGKWNRIVAALLLIGAMVGCDERTVYRSSVPTYPVNIRINTYEGMYVNFVRENIYTYLTVDKDGYHFQGQTMPRTELDRFGYAGIVVYIDGFGNYNAFDMACPHCVKQDKPVKIEGMFAECENCGEVYDLGSGYATPQKGISIEAMRKYSVVYANGVITVRN